LIIGLCLWQWGVWQYGIAVVQLILLWFAMEALSFQRRGLTGLAVINAFWLVLSVGATGLTWVSGYFTASGHVPTYFNAIATTLVPPLLVLPQIIVATRKDWTAGKDQRPID
jgi:hypothetical protein